MLVLYALGAVVLAAILYMVVLALYNRTKQTLHELKMLDLDRAQREADLDLDRAQQHFLSTQPLYPDSLGNYPLLWDGSQCLDPGRGLLFNFAGGLLSASPEVARPEQLARILRAGGGWPMGAAAENLLPGPANVNWPSRIPLAGLLEGTPSFRDLALGVTVKDDGQTEIVRADMGKLIHVAVGGSSGWGKSVFLRMLAYQLAKSRDPVDLVLIDLEGATFAPFANCGRLLWPVADTEADALAILQELTGEMDRRKELFNYFPGVDSLGAYNAKAAEPLTPVVALVDEATALLGDKSVEGALRTLALRARKYGLGLILGGQDWKSGSLDTAIRNQLSSRIQFKAMSKSQSRVLLQQTGAEALDTKGRALAVLPGRAMFVMQAPFISAERILEDLGNGGPRGSMPVMAGDSKADLVRQLDAEGLPPSVIAQTVYGYKNARTVEKVRQILESDR